VNILLVYNRTITRQGISRLDLGFWTVYLPLLKLGHNVYFYDTVNPVEKDFSKVVESFKPDLVFCCLTGNSTITPHEPWEQLKLETEKGRTKTFNWFCDDTWRFENFSKQVCFDFHVCSTPEQSRIRDYKEMGYDNIVLGLWHANRDLYPEHATKNIPVSFCGAPNNDRINLTEMLKSQGINIQYFHGVSYEDMLLHHASSQIGLNFSKNMTDGGESKTQMKARLFEVPAAKTLLLTEYHEGIEEYFEIDKEIICFTNNVEMVKKTEFLLSKPNLINKIAENGYNRAMRDHESSVRLSNVLEEVMKK